MSENKATLEAVMGFEAGYEKGVRDALQQKAFSHNKTLSAFLREAGLVYNPVVEGKNEKV